MQPNHQFIIAPTHQQAMQFLSEIGQNPKNWIVLANTNPAAWTSLRGRMDKAKALFIADGNYSHGDRLEEIMNILNAWKVNIERVHFN